MSNTLQNFVLSSSYLVRGRHRIDGHTDRWVQSVMQHLFLDEGPHDKPSIRFCTVSTRNRPLAAATTVNESPQVHCQCITSRYSASKRFESVPHAQSVLSGNVDSLIVPVVCLPECLFVQFCDINALFSSNFIKYCNGVLGSLTPNMPVICRHLSYR